jgi:hypothetical protein
VLMIVIMIMIVCGTAVFVVMRMTLSINELPCLVSGIPIY